MTDPVHLKSPFSVGDVVQPKPDCDLALLFNGRRTPPGPVVLVTEYGGLMVAGPDGRALPYAPHELERADAC